MEFTWQCEERDDIFSTYVKYFSTYYIHMHSWYICKNTILSNSVHVDGLKDFLRSITWLWQVTGQGLSSLLIKLRFVAHWSTERSARVIIHIKPLQSRGFFKYESGRGWWKSRHWSDRTWERLLHPYHLLWIWKEAMSPEFKVAYRMEETKKQTVSRISEKNLPLTQS